MQEIFSGSSVEELIEWHGTSLPNSPLLYSWFLYVCLAKVPSRESEQQKAIEIFTKAMEDMTNQLNKHETFLENFQRRSEAFHTHLQLLDSCASLDEVTTRVLEFERELDLRVGPAPAFVRVANDASRRNGFGASSDATTEDGGEKGKGKERESGNGGLGENGKHCISMYDKDKDREMVDVSEAPPLVLVAL